MKAKWGRRGKNGYGKGRMFGVYIEDYDFIRDTRTRFSVVPQFSHLGRRSAQGRKRDSKGLTH